MYERFGLQSTAGYCVLTPSQTGQIQLCNEFV
jgi:hypothetical protein